MQVRNVNYIERGSTCDHVDYFIDITSDICPMTFVKTKLAIERMAAGQCLEVRLKGAEPLENVPRSVREHGHEVLSLSPEAGSGDDVPHRLIVRKR